MTVNVSSVQGRHFALTILCVLNARQENLALSNAESCLVCLLRMQLLIWGAGNKEEEFNKG